MCIEKPNVKDIQPGAYLIRGREARLITTVVDGVVIYCKFAAETGRPYGQKPAACMIRTLLNWADRLASSGDIARYNPELIMAVSRAAAENWLTEMQALVPSDLLCAELQLRGFCRRVLRKQKASFLNSLDVCTRTGVYYRQGEQAWKNW